MPSEFAPYPPCRPRELARVYVPSQGVVCSLDEARTRWPHAPIALLRDRRLGLIPVNPTHGDGTAQGEPAAKMARQSNIELTKCP